MRQTHPFGPVYDENSKILILGSFPSVKSREQNFFYGHPQNRFWKVLACIFSKGSECSAVQALEKCDTVRSAQAFANIQVPETVDQKKKFLLDNRIAVWDVIESCEIEGSADSSIKNVKANDLSRILSCAQIEKILINGRTAEKYYNKYMKRQVTQVAICLPSTSPANAAWTLDKLVEAWGAAIK